MRKSFKSYCLKTTLIIKKRDYKTKVMEISTVKYLTPKISITRYYSHKMKSNKFIILTKNKKLLQHPLISLLHQKLHKSPQSFSERKIKMSFNKCYLSLICDNFSPQ
jgi:hypothetical protein